MVREILRRAAVQKATGLSRSTIYAMMSAATFPKPVKLGRRAVGWIAQDVIAWQAARIAERDGQRKAAS
jgi:prophage regulatory protein